MGIFWVIFAHFCGVFYVSLFIDIFSWNFAEMFLVLLCWSLHTKNPEHGFLYRGSFWVTFGLILMYVPIFLEKCLIFSHEILYRYSWYIFSDNQHTISFFHALFSWNPFWCMFHYFVRIIRYFLMKSCIDVFSTTLWWSLQ